MRSEASGTQPASPVAGLSDLTVLARGGYSTVYRARQDSIGREVALKIDTRSLESERDRRRFVREAEAAGRMSGHPNVVNIYDAGVTPDNHPYLVMELCTGGSYAARLRERGPLSPVEVRDVGVKIADALQAAHDNGILHRDVKPGNILINRYGVPGLADFGLAALPDPSRELSVTIEALTPAYAPPEVFRMEAPSPLGDQFSLGASLYALLSGRPPRWPETGTPSLATMVMILDEPIPDIPGVPPGLSAVLRRAMAPYAEDRYPSAGEFRDALASLDLESDTGSRAAGFSAAPTIPGPQSGPPSSGAPSSGPPSGGFGSASVPVSGGAPYPPYGGAPSAPQSGPPVQQSGPPAPHSGPPGPHSGAPTAHGMPPTLYGTPPSGPPPYGQPPGGPSAPNSGPPASPAAAYGAPPVSGPGGGRPMNQTTVFPANTFAPGGQPPGGPPPYPPPGGFNAPPGGPRKSNGSKRLVVILAVVVAVLLVAGGIGAAAIGFLGGGGDDTPTTLEPSGDPGPTAPTQAPSGEPLPSQSGEIPDFPLDLPTGTAGTDALGSPCDVAVLAARGAGIQARCPSGPECWRVKSDGTYQSRECTNNHTWETFVIGQLASSESSANASSLKADANVQVLCSDAVLQGALSATGQDPSGWRIAVSADKTGANFRCLAGKGENTPRKAVFVK
ncbi:serine/threonine-protein kinase [Cryptosporangium phraense]|uniref:serine/threonine-protein kinase n=1 Tax=Cryptosporangium phraense TaxID=2593070 RepID=UPI00197AE03D|nr:serine/threonine-protein kinase [Cryptosporangium phraense]